MTALAVVMWVSIGLLVYAHFGYGALLWLVARTGRAPATGTAAGELPRVSVIVAAYAEEDVIADRVANLRALDYPAERLEVIVACDGSTDATAARARQAGADIVLELPRGGKVRAQDAGVAAATSRLSLPSRTPT